MDIRRGKFLVCPNCKTEIGILSPDRAAFEKAMADLVEVATSHGNSMGMGIGSSDDDDTGHFVERVRALVYGELADGK